MMSCGLACDYGKPAFAQTSSNSSDLGVPTDDPAAGLGLYNSTNPSAALENPASGAGQGTSATVPEFGSVAPVVLAVAAMAIVVASSRSRLGFR